MKRIQTQFYLYFTLLTVCPLLILSVFSYINIKQNAEKDIINAIYYDLKSTQAIFDAKWYSSRKLTDIVISYDELYNSLMPISVSVNNGQFTYAQFKAFTLFSNHVKNLLDEETDIEFAMLIVSGRCVYQYRNFVSITKDLSRTELYTKISQNPGITWLSYVDNPFDEIHGTYTVVSKNLTSVMNGNPTINNCQFMLFINQEKLTDYLEQSLRFGDGFIAVLDENNKLVAANRNMENDALDKYLLSGIQKSQDIPGINVIGDNAMSAITSDKSNWTFVQMIPTKYIFTTSQWIITVTIMLLACLFILLILFSFLISLKILRPVKTLAYAMKELTGTHFEIRVPDYFKNELGEIFRGFNEMAVRIKELFELTLEKEEQKRLFQIDMLKYQINPHFLYNSLSSIRYLALKHGDEFTAEMLATLSRLLRSTLNNKNKNIPLTQEIKNIEDYISLQQARYDARINVIYNIDNTTRSLYMPSMLLQPIVENAIMHGLSDKLNSLQYAEIIVSTFIEGRKLIISIVDNGLGMSEKKMEQALTSSLGNGDDSPHIGITNINDRIRLLFGNNYGITIKSEAGEYTDMRISLPIRHDEEANI